MVTNDNNDDDDGNRYDDDDFKLHHLQMGPNQWCLDLRDGRKQEYPTLVTPGTNFVDQHHLHPETGPACKHNVGMRSLL